MIYFTLPDMIYNVKLNNYLIRLNQEKPEYFKFPITFFSINGNFNYTLWNGELNNNFGPFLTYKNLTITQKYNIPIRFDCSNTYLKQVDFYDEYMNTILKLNEKDFNYIELADFDLMDYIKKQYPKYHFILSNSMHLYYKFTVDFLNDISRFNVFDLIKIPSNYLNLSKLTNKEKYEIIINPWCNFDCQNYEECYNLEQLNQINYSDQQIIKQCINADNKITINLESLIDNGFKYFSFTQGHKDIEFFVHFFIKEKYQQKIIEEYNDD